MSTVRESLLETSTDKFERRGRLDPTVREIAARTQVPIEDFSHCPNCGEPMDDQFIHLDMEVCRIDFRCENCEKTGSILDTGHVEYLSIENTKDSTKGD